MACALSENRPSLVTSTFASGLRLAGAAGPGPADAPGVDGGSIVGDGGLPPGPVSGVETPPCAAFGPGTPHTVGFSSAVGSAPGSSVGTGAGADCAVLAGPTAAAPLTDIELTGATVGAFAGVLLGVALGAVLGALPPAPDAEDCARAMDATTSVVPIAAHHADRARGDVAEVLSFGVAISALHLAKHHADALTWNQAPLQK
jgi:surface antigen